MIAVYTETDRVIRIIEDSASSRITDTRIYEMEIERYKLSRERGAMITGARYYAGHHDILDRRRTVIGNQGLLEEVGNLPNNRLVDNQYRKMVTQKTNYLLGQPLVFKSSDERHNELLKGIFGKSFMRLLKNVGKDAINLGLGWLFAGYDNYGNLTFRRLKAYDVIPLWADEDHTVLDCAIRLYTIIEYEGRSEKKIEKVEVYNRAGVHRYTYKGGRLTPDEIPYSPYLIASDDRGAQVGYNWQNIPLIPFKSNSEATPLINHVKSLQDGINLILSNFQNNMEEDARNTVWVLINYGGTDISEFRKNLATCGVVNVESVGAHQGDIRTMQVEVNSSNYESILRLFKQALIENAMGYDAKDDRLGSNPNQMNIQSMYSDVDLAANEMETEFQASLETLLWFVNAHLANTGEGDFSSAEVEIIFNRDILINENEAIEGCRKSTGILSRETIVSNHPWVDDPLEELRRIESETQASVDLYKGAFPIMESAENA